MVESGDLAVEPEVDAGDGSGFEVGELVAEGRGFWSLGQDAVEIFEGQGEDEVVEEFVFFRRRGFGLATESEKSFDRGAEADFTPAGANVIPGAVVEVGERDGGKRPCGGRRATSWIHGRLARRRGWR